MTATLLGLLFIAGIVLAGGSLLASVGHYGAAALALPEQLRSCRTRDDMRFRVRAPINPSIIALAPGSSVRISDRRLVQRSPAWLAAA